MSSRTAHSLTSHSRYFSISQFKQAKFTKTAWRDANIPPIYPSRLHPRAPPVSILCERYAFINSQHHQDVYRWHQVVCESQLHRWLQPPPTRPQQLAAWSRQYGSWASMKPSALLCRSEKVSNTHKRYMDTISSKPRHKRTYRYAGASSLKSASHIQEIAKETNQKIGIIKRCFSGLTQTKSHNTIPSDS